MDAQCQAGDGCTRGASRGVKLIWNDDQSRPVVPMCRRHAREYQLPTLRRTRFWRAVAIAYVVVLGVAFLGIAFVITREWWQRGSLLVILFNAGLLVAYLLFFLPRALTAAHGARPCLADYRERQQHTCVLPVIHRSAFVPHLCDCAYIWELRPWEKPPKT